ncbi:protein precursor [Hypoxylon sp. NC1633]|nr:protein precursor [Hypoxylon sp. NC1633]
MAYILYTLTFVVLITGTILYLTRAHWLPLLPGPPSLIYRYSRLPAGGSSFEGDLEAGLSSNTFDLSANVEGGDSRAGLDDDAKTAILAIMKKRRLRFDEARRVYLEQRFSANGIAADGRPKDPKFVSFS